MLEVFFYDYFIKVGMLFVDVDVKYFNILLELVVVFINGVIDVVSYIEFYVI